MGADTLKVLANNVIDALQAIESGTTATEPSSSSGSTPAPIRPQEFLQNKEFLRFLVDFILNSEFIQNKGWTPDEALGHTQTYTEALHKWNKSEKAQQYGTIEWGPRGSSAWDVAEQYARHQGDNAFTFEEWKQQNNL